MDKLSDCAGPIETFKRCQLCAYESDDICEFWQWIECNDTDEPTDKILITCRRSRCMKEISDHPRLYIQMEWGKGKPGQFMLLCGDCKFRNDSSCTHPDLKSNGGQGLEIRFQSVMPFIACTKDGMIKGGTNPAVHCAGKEGGGGR